MPSPIRLLEDGDARILASLPNLAQRVANFQKQYLEKEPCATGGCFIMSVTSHMCVACRLRLMFFHSVYNADSYDPKLGEEDA